MTERNLRLIITGVVLGAAMACATVLSAVGKLDGATVAALIAGIVAGFGGGAASGSSGPSAGSIKKGAGVVGLSALLIGGAAILGGCVATLEVTKSGLDVLSQANDRVSGVAMSYYKAKCGAEIAKCEATEDSTCAGLLQCQSEAMDVVKALIEVNGLLEEAYSALAFEDVADAAKHIDAIRKRLKDVREKMEKAGVFKSISFVMYVPTRAAPKQKGLAI